MDTALRRVITLLYANLAISVVLGLLTFVFYGEIVDFQVAHVLAGQAATPDLISQTRSVFTNTTWIRPVSVLMVSVVYVRIAGRLQLGKRITYLRVLLIAVLGFGGLAYLVAAAQFPVWMRVGQAVQALVLLGLLFAATRPAVRARFTKVAATAVQS